MPYELTTIEASGMLQQTTWLRELAEAGFRRKKLVAICFAAVLLGAVAAPFLMTKYEAHLTLLVERQRVDPLVSGERADKPADGVVTESEVNSELSLLTSDDVLREVVMDNHLDQQQFSWLGATAPEVRIARAVRKLRSRLATDVVRKTTIIQVRYADTNPRRAAAVLQSLSQAYLKKHTQVHRRAGQYEFFEKQAEVAKQRLDAAEARLQDFSHKEGVASPQLERDNTLQKLSELGYTVEQTKASVRETQNRVTELKSLEASTPARVTTQLRHTDNPQLMQQLKATLLQLELKRTELLSKFEPTYRPVVEVEQQIRETQAAIRAEDSQPLRDETTDQNPTNQWVRSELAKANADLSSYRAREAGLTKSVAAYEDRAHELQSKQLQEQDLARAAKSEEEQYLLYVRKREEARISDALDQQRIVNVSVAEAPSVPALPARSFTMYLALGLLLAIFTAIVATVVAEYSDQAVRTSRDLSALPNVPLLAVIPYQRGTLPPFGAALNGNASPEQGPA